MPMSTVEVSRQRWAQSQINAAFLNFSTVLFRLYLGQKSCVLYSCLPSDLVQEFNFSIRTTCSVHCITPYLVSLSAFGEKNNFDSSKP